MVNFDDVKRAMAGVVAEAEQAERDFRTVALKRAQTVLAAARERVPVVSGKLKESLYIVEEADKQQFSVEPADVEGRSVMVPVYVEFGTKHMPAKPFLRPALDENRDGYLAEQERVALEHLKKAVT